MKSATAASRSRVSIANPRLPVLTKRIVASFAARCPSSINSVGHHGNVCSNAPRGGDARDVKLHRADSDVAPYAVRSARAPPCGVRGNDTRPRVVRVPSEYQRLVGVRHDGAKKPFALGGVAVPIVEVPVDPVAPDGERARGRHRHRAPADASSGSRRGSSIPVPIRPRSKRLRPRRVPARGGFGASRRASSAAAPASRSGGAASMTMLACAYTCQRTPASRDSRVSRSIQRVCASPNIRFPSLERYASNSSRMASRRRSRALPRQSPGAGVADVAISIDAFAKTFPAGSAFGSVPRRVASPSPRTTPRRRSAPFDYTPPRARSDHSRWVRAWVTTRGTRESPLARDRRISPRDPSDDPPRRPSTRYSQSRDRVPHRDERRGRAQRHQTGIRAV